jgi:nucleotide-binding universal stress UspA family protein
MAAGHADEALHPTPLLEIVCGIDGGPGAEDAVRQATALAGEGAVIELVAVTDERAFGPVDDVLFTQARARTAIEHAAAIAERRGFATTGRVIIGDSPARALLRAADQADLLVVGGHGNSRMAGILLGSTASRLLHTAAVPVLVTRSGHAEPLRNVLVGAGGSFGATAIDFSARLAAERPDTRLTLVRVDGQADPVHRSELAAAAARLEQGTGIEPVELLVHGAVVHAIVAAARTHDASLVVIGARALTSVAALRSVSERVAHEAPCSVLVVRPRQADGGWRAPGRVSVESTDRVGG